MSFRIRIKFEKENKHENKSLLCSAFCLLTCSEVDHGCRSSCDGTDLRVDFMFGFVHFVLNPGSGRLLAGEEQDLLACITVGGIVSSCELSCV